MTTTHVSNTTSATSASGLGSVTGFGAALGYAKDLYHAIRGRHTDEGHSIGYLLGLTLGNAALGTLDLLKSIVPAFSMVMPISGIGLALMDLKVRVKSLIIARRNIRRITRQAIECDVNDKEVMQDLRDRAHKEQISVLYGLGYVFASIVTTLGLIVPPLMIVGAAITGAIAAIEHKETVARIAKKIIKAVPMLVIGTVALAAGLVMGAAWLAKKIVATALVGTVAVGALVARTLATAVVSSVKTGARVAKAATNAAIAGAKSIFSTVKNFLFGKKPVVKEAVQPAILATRMTNGAAMMRELTRPSVEPRTRVYIASSRTPNASVTPGTRASAPIYLNTRASQNRNSMYAQQNQAPVAKDVANPTRRSRMSARTAG